MHSGLIINTDLRIGINIGYMYSAFLEIVFQAAIGHERKDEERVAIGCIETNANQTQNVGVTKVLHDQAL